MDFPIQIKAIRMRLSIIYILRGHRNKFPNYVAFQSLRIVFILENSADPDEMQYSAAFHLGLHCFSQYPFRGFQQINGY